MYRLGQFIRVEFRNGTQFAKIYHIDDKGFSAYALSRRNRVLRDGWPFYFTEDLSYVTILDERPTQEDIDLAYNA